jgi:hypothetical protein
MELVWLIKEQLTELMLIAWSNEQLIPFMLFRLNHNVKFNVADGLPLLWKGYESDPLLHWTLTSETFYTPIQNKFFLIIIKRHIVA